MKTRWWREMTGVAAGAMLVCATPVRADIVEKQVVVGDRVISFPVFDPKGAKRKLESVIGFRVPPPPVIAVVPEHETRMVHPALETEETRPRPRFGYGSDWEPGGEAGSAREAPRSDPKPSEAAQAAGIPSLAPVIQFHHSYRPREYWSAWSALPYLRYFDHDCRYAAYPWGLSSHRRWSGTSVSIRTPCLSFWFSR